MAKRKKKRSKSRSKKTRTETKNAAPRENATAVPDASEVAAKILEPVERQLSKRIQLIILAVCVATAGLLAFAGLTNHLFWDDEANTAIFARNLIQHGELTAWDGTNLVAFRNGAELDENLINVFMPPLQYYVTAVSFALFGESTFTARAPFVILGLITIVMLFFLCRRLFGGNIIGSIACFVLASNVQYLLYIRNCRYYALGALFTVTLFYFFTRHEKGKQTLPWASHLGVTLSVVALFLTSYFNAVAAVLFLPLLMLLHGFRDRARLGLLCNAIVSAGAMGIYSIAVRNPFDSHQIGGDELGLLENALGLLSYYVRDIGFFEFFPVLVIPILILPFVWKRLVSMRGFVLRALLLLGLFVIYFVVVALFSPQEFQADYRIIEPGQVNFADMRYLVPLIPIGAICTAVTIATMWRMSRWVGALMVLILLFSNTLYLGSMNIHDLTLKPKGVQCTLCRYVGEAFNDYDTSTETIIEYLRTEEPGTSVVILPSYLMFSPMFYLDHLHYSKLITVDTPLTTEKRALLPSYVLRKFRSDPPDIVIAKRLPNGSKGRSMKVYGVMYRKKAVIPYLSMDSARPEIPWHGFGEEEVREGFFRPLYVFERVSN